MRPRKTRKLEVADAFVAYFLRGLCAFSDAAFVIEVSAFSCVASYKQTETYCQNTVRVHLAMLPDDTAFFLIASVVGRPFSKRLLVMC